MQESSSSPRLFYGNFDFENEIAGGDSRPLSGPARRLTSLLSSSWLLLAAAGDVVWTPDNIPEEFWERAVRLGFPRVQRVENLTSGDVPAWHMLYPWGWSEPMRRLQAEQSARIIRNCVDERSASLGLAEYEAKRTLPEVNAVRLVNARAFSFGLEQEWNCGLEGARRVETVAELFEGAGALSARSTDNGGAWLLKANFAMSGRERLAGRGLPGPREVEWLARRLAARPDDGAFFLEPLVSRLEEAGLQWEIPPLPSGAPRLVGITELWCDTRGSFLGAVFSTDEDRQACWQTAVDVGRAAAERAQAAGYFGPLGIDAMRYRCPVTGDIRIRPLQDINARLTMGRLSLGLQQFQRPDEIGVWLHLRRFGDKLAREKLSDESPCGNSEQARWIRDHLLQGIGRWLPTSPDKIGSVAATHETGAWILNVKHETRLRALQQMDAGRE